MTTYSNRRIGIYAVELTVTCGRTTCPNEDEAAVRAGSCEEARTGVMRVLRYRGWQLGKHAATLCPKHAPPPVQCATCTEVVPPIYCSPRGQHYPLAHLDEFKDIPSTALLCEECVRRAGVEWRAQLTAERAS